MPVEPPPGRWAFPSIDSADDDGLVGVGADLEPGTLLSAYRHGVFPMPVGRGGTWGGGRRTPGRCCRSAACGSAAACGAAHGATRSGWTRRSTGWWRRAPTRCDPTAGSAPRSASPTAALHDLGWAHSVEAWAEDGSLAGGLYGVAVAGLFAGESMFHRRTDASKAALMALVEHLVEGGAEDRLLDVQWQTPHLASLGVVEIPRREYMRRLTAALRRPLPPVFGL